MNSLQESELGVVRQPIMEETRRVGTVTRGTSLARRADEIGQINGGTNPSILAQYLKSGVHAETNAVTTLPGQLLFDPNRWYEPKIDLETWNPVFCVLTPDS